MTTDRTKPNSHDWTEPGVFEVAPGVHRIPLPLPNDGLRSVNVYAIMEMDGLVLIDSGWALPEAREALESALGTLGCGLGDVRRIFITHVHRDHYSQAVALRRAFGIPISIGVHEERSLNVLTSPGHGRLTAQLALLNEHDASEVAEKLQSVGAGLPVVEGMWEMPDDFLADDVEIHLPSRNLRVIHTPGHTQGHVVYADENEALLFAGDHVLPHITPSIGFEPVPGAQPLRDYVESLRLMRSLPDKKLLPAHGPIGPSVHQRADEILEHHDARLKSSYDAITEGSSTASAVARQLTWTRRQTSFDDFDPFNRMLAVIETASHLDLLVLQGKLRTETLNGVRHFMPATSN